MTFVYVSGAAPIARAKENHVAAIKARLKTHTALAISAALYVSPPAPSSRLHGTNPGLRCTACLHRDKAAAADSSLGLPQIPF